MKKIPLFTYNKKIVKTAIVDDLDYGRVLSYSHSWHVDRFKTVEYARCKINKKSGKRMHQIILDAPKGMVIDHINGNGLDNRRENLRICTIGQNVRAKHFISSKSKYKGVYKQNDGRPKCYQAYINAKELLNKRVVIGSFFTDLEAAACYNAAAEILHGEYAILNEI